jgi:hypothetical protein
MLLSTYQKDSDNPARAEIHEDRRGYKIHFYSPDGSLFKTESYHDKSIFYVQDVAENYISGIKVLNG